MPNQYGNDLIFFFVFFCLVSHLLSIENRIKHINTSFIIALGCLVSLFARLWRRQTHTTTTKKNWLGHFILSFCFRHHDIIACCLCCCNHLPIGKLAHFCCLVVHTHTQFTAAAAATAGCFKSNHLFNMLFKFFFVLSLPFSHIQFSRSFLHTIFNI